MIKDEQIQKALLCDGFAVVGKLDDDAFLKLRSLHQQDETSRIDSFLYSLLNHPYEANKKILEEHRAILHPFFERHFSDYRTITESYLIKPALTETELLLHQDWCYTDEQRYQAYNVWIPMDSVSEENGALFFLSGSHRWFDTRRSGSLLTARISSQNSPVIKSTIVTVPMEKGQVLLFHPAVFHGSHPNRSTNNRVIVTTTVLDKEAPFLYYQKQSDDAVEVFQLEDERFIRDLGSLTRGERPSPESIETLSYRHIDVTEEMIEARISAGA